MNRTFGGAPKDDTNDWEVQAIVSDDDRGQMVLPKEVRKKAGIQPGDKLVLLTWENEDGIENIALIQTNQINPALKKVLKPLSH